MLVTGTYENGTVRLSESVHLKHDRIVVTVDIPDDEVMEEPIEERASAPEMASPLESLFRDLDAIRGDTDLPDDGISDREKFANARPLRQLCNERSSYNITGKKTL